MGKVSSVFVLQQDPAASDTSEADSDTREGETVAMNYKPSPLQVKIGEPYSISTRHTQTHTSPLLVPYICTASQNHCACVY